jgi:hypothetical protein
VRAGRFANRRPSDLLPISFARKISVDVVSVAPDRRNISPANIQETGPSWVPLRLPLRQIARRLQLSRERAVLEFEAAGINIGEEV